MGPSRECSKTRILRQICPVGSIWTLSGRWSHHTSAVVATVVLFAGVGFIIQRLLHDGPIKRVVLWVDELVVLCLFVYFAYELFISLWSA